jgi:hypothetical protein
MALADQQAGGELAVRLHKNFDRLEEENTSRTRFFEPTRRAFIGPAIPKVAQCWLWRPGSGHTQRTNRCFFDSILCLFRKR